MILKELKERNDIADNKKLNTAYIKFEKLLVELDTRALPDEINSFINTQVDALNLISDSGKEFKKQLCKKRAAIVKRVEKDLKIVPKNHYRNTWMILGMSIYGIPLGVVFGAIIGNMGLLGIGLPIGMVIGMAIGSKMDKKAAAEGRQLDVEFK